jgi:hypothetical protein
MHNGFQLPVRPVLLFCIPAGKENENKGKYKQEKPEFLHLAKTY